MSLGEEYGRIGHERGRAAEQALEHIVNKAIEQEACPAWIRKYSSVPPHSQDDKRNRCVGNY